MSVLLIQFRDGMLWQACRQTTVIGEGGTSMLQFYWGGEESKGRGVPVPFKNFFLSSRVLDPNQFESSIFSRCICTLKKQDHLLKIFRGCTCPSLIPPKVTMCLAVRWQMYNNTKNSCVTAVITFLAFLFYVTSTFLFETSNSSLWFKGSYSSLR